ncbi:MBOAT family O-acyltransferase [Sulfuriroseicoccus oceanibius]|uniref:MBOAT family protein n=1 Tax=Sulfuriroseicoccus oceanibius TaxID=2707525 RepID=A0A6B3L1R8_9BACT|nr:MBOAT family O-acyltransferase [Sulfuriroseicoccus oceanibius]QQL46309.1 MBOAT family protein [Sulfuriroseicoccus oceanibius]
MIFQSLEFLIFLALLVSAYWWLPHRVQNVLLLVASYVFYCWVHPWYGLLMGFTTLVDYTAARLLVARPAGSRGRKRILATSLTATFSVLCGFKYFNFFTDAVWSAFHAVGWDWSRPMIDILLPVGISFYTFQSASYVVDVFRGRERVRHSLVDYALFVSFFPQLVAGPIERAGHLLAQIQKPRVLDWTGWRLGLVRICWGMFKKLVIADGAGLIANRAFSIEDPSFPIVAGGVIAFGVQIYADFSAYTDIARGAARLLGFDLMRNFRHPYCATSPAEFWRRWHISLSTWFRDYVYIPLGGSRCKPRRVAVNLLVTFGLSGLWHGASWNFVIWGLYHGALVALQHLWSGFRKGKGESGGAPMGWVRTAGAWLATFVLMHVGWMMFREQNTEYLLSYFALVPWEASVADWETGLYFAVHAQILALPLWIHAAVDPGPTGWLERVWPRWENRWGGVVLQAVLVFLLVMATFALRSPVSSNFIYFQF